jgi:hypothetical protein
MVDPLVCLGAALAREDPDRRPAGALRAARCGGHHLAEAAGDDRAAALGEQAAHLFRPRLVLAAAADHGDLNCHGCDARQPWTGKHAAAH